jgi:hypothetical protein
MCGPGIGKVMACGQPRQKVSETLFQQNKPGVVAHVFNPSHLGGGVQ